MSPVSNSTLTNLMLLATISSSVISLSYDSPDSLMPMHEATYTHMINIAEWKDNAFNTLPDYSLPNEEQEKIQTIIGFSHQVLSNSTDIESEYVDIVNENFWDLI
jgi:hypothetical protein